MTFLEVIMIALIILVMGVLGIIAVGVSADVITEVLEGD